MKNEYIKLIDGSIFEYTSLRLGERLVIHFVEDVDVNELKEKDLDSIGVYNRGDSKLTTIEGYNTIYKIDGQIVEFSNDGSIYIKPNDYERVSFNGQRMKYDIESIYQNGNLLTIVFVNSIPENVDTSTVIEYDVYDEKKATFKGYDTVYRASGKTLELSNDGSIYVEPRDHEYVMIGDDENKYDIISVNAEDNLLTIVFVDDICDVPGTVIRYSVNYQELERYEGYTTLYRINGTTVQFSNDGSEYDPEAEAAKELAEVKSAKISEMSDICSKAISDGVDVELNGEVVHFTYTTEDQQNIKAAFDLANLTNFAVPYHADAMSCRLFAPKEISKVYVAEQVNLTHHTTYFNQLKQSILAMDNVEDVKNVTYGQPLTGEYLETYNAMMAQTQRIIDAMTGGE